uniref:FI18027p1 n=1 Tax=Drosophila melanogaster TaxID=7227 RepID=H5V867_DROME|nr:FI18027p1 [Drosophila melanogaster]
MDCAVIPLKRHKDYLLIQTVDFFYPMVNDPELLGRIALANVLSDVYAVGVTQFDTVEMIVSTSTSFSEKERDVVIGLVMKGFQNSLKANGYRNTPLIIRQLKINPWCIIGGIATSVCRSEEIILPSNAQPGDVLVLTKPLGGQMAMDAHLWQLNQTEKYKKLLSECSDADIKETFEIAVKSMTYLNKNAALLMHKYQAHCATDITGFGLLGHANNLAQFQKEKHLGGPKHKVSFWQIGGNLWRPFNMPSC